MRGYVGLTDYDWYRAFQYADPPAAEVNFWRPGAATFRTLQPGEPFFFKLKASAPLQAICGFGLFARYALLPAWRAWDVFGYANGTPSELDLLKRLARLSGGSNQLNANRMVGCIAITEPIFFAPDEWVAPPADWKRNIVSGKTYDLGVGEGMRIYRECLERAEAMAQAPEWSLEELDGQRHGKPQLIRPRLGQGSFRLAVLDAYGNACAVTTEHSLPVLEASHIRPWGQGGQHEVSNGLPLRRDLHRLFDLGFVTVRPDHRLQVSDALESDYSNGKAYYEMQGRKIVLPSAPGSAPDPEALAWHGSAVFRG